MKGCGGECESRPRNKKRLLIVESPPTTADSFGQINLDDDSTWVSEGRWMVEIVPRGGGESRIFNQIEATATSLLKGPRTDVSMKLTRNPSWRLRCSDRYGVRRFEVVGCDEVGREVHARVTERKQ